jgi:hypothetical protein
MNNVWPADISGVAVERSIGKPMNSTPAAVPGAGESWRATSVTVPALEHLQTPSALPFVKSWPTIPGPASNAWNTTFPSASMRGGKSLPDPGTAPNWSKTTPAGVPAACSPLSATRRTTKPP